MAGAPALPGVSEPTFGTYLELKHREALFWAFTLTKIALHVRIATAQGLYRRAP
jgi:hypothetical protein